MNRVKGVLGVDPGASGGVAILNEDTLIFEPMQTLDGVLNHSWLREFVERERDGFNVAYVEAVSAMPGQGVTSMFSFGRNLGGIEGVLSALRVPIVFVRPQVWQKEFFPPSKKGEKLTPTQKKERCVKAAKLLYPSESFMATERSKVPHLGLVDATLIATYGKKQQ